MLRFGAALSLPTRKFYCALCPIYYCDNCEISMTALFYQVHSIPQLPGLAAEQRVGLQPAELAGRVQQPAVHAAPGAGRLHPPRLRRHLHQQLRGDPERAARNAVHHTHQRQEQLHSGGQ